MDQQLKQLLIALMDKNDLENTVWMDTIQQQKLFISLKAAR
jgi:hypothetical protein